MKPGRKPGGIAIFRRGVVELWRQAIDHQLGGL